MNIREVSCAIESTSLAVIGVTPSASVRVPSAGKASTVTERSATEKLGAVGAWIPTAGPMLSVAMPVLALLVGAATVGEAGRRVEQQWVRAIFLYPQTPD
jgi:hypothetical protein